MTGLGSLQMRVTMRTGELELVHTTFTRSSYTNETRQTKVPEMFAVSLGYEFGPAMGRHLPLQALNLFEEPRAGVSP